MESDSSMLLVTEITCLTLSIKTIIPLFKVKGIQFVGRKLTAKGRRMYNSVKVNSFGINRLESMRIQFLSSRVSMFCITTS